MSFKFEDMDITLPMYRYLTVEADDQVQIMAANKATIIKQENGEPLPAMVDDAHKYRIVRKEPVMANGEPAGELVLSAIQFQAGPVKEQEVNGIQNEHLLMIVEDRLKFFQNGDFACIENKNALQCVQQALKHLNDRTKRRIKQGVEGTNQGN